MESRTAIGKTLLVVHPERRRRVPMSSGAVGRRPPRDRARGPHARPASDPATEAARRRHPSAYGPAIHRDATRRRYLRLVDMPPRTSTTDDAAPAVRLEQELTERRRELTGYCYRMLGSAFEAEDAVQETMIRAWKAIDRFEGRSSLRSWLYRIATNVCLDMLNGRQRRARPMDLGPASVADGHAARRRLAEETWVQPIADAQGRARRRRPRRGGRRRETRSGSPSSPPCSTLPARQRAVLILREVLRWQATEVAELLDTSVASVNSALQRARATLADVDPEADEPDRRRPRRSRRSARPLRRGVRALRHPGAGRPAPRGRHDVDAAVRAVAAGPRRDRQVASRPGRGVRGLAPAPSRWRTAGRPSASTRSTRPVASPRGRCRCSTSRAARSCRSATSCTPTCSRSSGCPRTSTDRCGWLSDGSATARDTPAAPERPTAAASPRRSPRR